MRSRSISLSAAMSAPGPSDAQARPIGDISKSHLLIVDKKKDRLAAVSLESRSGVLTRRLRCALYFFQLFSCVP